MAADVVRPSTERSAAHVAEPLGHPTANRGRAGGGGVGSAKLTPVNARLLPVDRAWCAIDRAWVREVLDPARRGGGRA